MRPPILLTSIAALFSVLHLQTAEDQSRPPVPPPRASQPDLGSEIVARGKGVSVKRRQLDEAVVAYRASASARGESISEADREKVEAGILDRLVFTQILIGKSTSEDKAKAKELAEKLINGFREQARTPERFAAQLKTLGLTEESFRNQVLDQAICEQVLDRELRAKLSVTDGQARKFYEENEAQFQEPERVRAAHILFSTQDAATGESLPDAKLKEKRELAEKVLARARAGEDFAKLAKEFSDDQGSKEAGGEYTFPRGQMVPEFEAAAFSMKTNQISDLITTKYGFHIIRLNEKLPPRKLEFAKVEKEIKEYLANEELRKQLPGYLEKIKQEAAVEILRPKPPNAEPPTQATSRPDRQKDPGPPSKPRPD
jgi:peptidyl-prolyl cis-trans isomerase C